MYVGPWQELRLSKLIDSVASNSTKQIKFGRRAQPDNSTEFQALLSQLSQVYGHDNAERLAAFLPLFQSSHDDNNSEFGDSTLSAPTPRGTPTSARSTASRATDNGGTSSNLLLQPLPKGRSLGRRKRNHKKTSAAELHRQRIEKMRQLYGMDHHPGEMCEHLIKAAVIPSVQPQVHTNNVAAAAGFPMTEQERRAIVSPGAKRSPATGSIQLSPRRPPAGSARSRNVTINTAVASCFTTQQATLEQFSPRLRSTRRSPHAPQHSSPRNALQSPQLLPPPTGNGSAASEVGDDEVDDLLNWACNLGGSSPSATQSSLFKF